MSGVVLKDSLYVLGGYATEYLDCIQQLSLDRLHWDLLPLKLPHKGRYIPCFKADSKAYFVIEKTLYMLLPLQVKKVKQLTQKIYSWRGASLYSEGHLYCSHQDGEIDRWHIGDLRA
jgi:hypothetical protein